MAPRAHSARQAPQSRTVPTAVQCQPRSVQEPTPAMRLASLSLTVPVVPLNSLVFLPYSRLPNEDPRSLVIPFLNAHVLSPGLQPADRKGTRCWLSDSNRTS